MIPYSSDKELSPLLTSSQLEDEETGETGEEKVFKVGDKHQHCKGQHHRQSY